MPAPDCRTCGACCGPQYDEETHVDLVDVDLRRLSPRWRRANVIEGVAWRTGSAIRTVHNENGIVCAALRGSVGRRVSCSIYERRPEACRAFRPGSRDCLDARRNVGLDLEAVSIPYAWRHRRDLVAGRASDAYYAKGWGIALCFRSGWYAGNGEVGSIGEQADPPRMYAPMVGPFATTAEAIGAYDKAMGLRSAG